MQGNIGVFGGIFANLFYRDLSHGKLFFPFRTDEFFDGHRLVVEIYIRQIVHIVVLFGL